MLYFLLFWNLNSKKAAIMIYDCDDHDVGSLYCAFKKRYASAASAGFTPSMFGTIRSHPSLMHATWQVIISNWHDTR